MQTSPSDEFKYIVSLISCRAYRINVPSINYNDTTFLKQIKAIFSFYDN